MVILCKGANCMKIKIINPNTTWTMTEDIAIAGKKFARPDTEVYAVSPSTGPESIESMYDEYLAVPDEEHVYAPLNEVRRRAGIPDVKEAWETYAKNPGKVATKEGMRKIIHREWDIEFAFEGRRFWNLRRWLTAVDELNEEQYGWNIVGQNAREFYNNFREPVRVWAKRKFISPRDYLFPLQSEEVMISGCVQNPGW